MTSRLVNVAVATAYGTVQWCKITRNRTIFSVGRNIVAGSEVGELDSNPTDFNSDHALVEISSTVGTAYRILIAGTTMLALAARRPQASCFLCRQSHACKEFCYSYLIGLLTNNLNHFKHYRYFFLIFFPFFFFILQI